MEPIGVPSDACRERSGSREAEERLKQEIERLRQELAERERQIGEQAKRIADLERLASGAIRKPAARRSRASN